MAFLSVADLRANPKQGCVKTLLSMLLAKALMCHSGPRAASARIMFFSERRDFSKNARRSRRFVAIERMRSEARLRGVPEAS